MRLTCVGTGTAAPSPTRVQAGAFITAGPHRVLVDCGSGVAHRLAALGLDWGGITHLAITHFHADHVADLVTLFVAWRHGQRPGRTAPLTVVGPPGLLARFEAMGRAFDVDLTAGGFPVTVIELPRDGALALGRGVTLTAHPVPHTPESVAYSVVEGGRRLVCSGDTPEDRGFAAWAAGCDVLLLECSLPDPPAVASHLTPAGAGRVAAAARPGRLVLTHFYPPLEGADIAGVVARDWSGPVVLAHDGLTLDV